MPELLRAVMMIVIKKKIEKRYQPIKEKISHHHWSKDSMMMLKMTFMEKIKKNQKSAMMIQLKMELKVVTMNKTSMMASVQKTNLLGSSTATTTRIS